MRIDIHRRRDRELFAAYIYCKAWQQVTHPLDIADHVARDGACGAS